MPYRLRCGGGAVRQGRHEGGGIEPPALLRGRELWPVHALPCRHRESGQIDDDAALGRAAIAGTDAGDERRLDLRFGAGRDEPGDAGVEAFPRGSDAMSNEKMAQFPADVLLTEELAREGLVEMANQTSAQTGITGTIFMSTAMGAHGPRVKYF